MEPTEYLQELERALDEFRFDDVDRLTNRIDPAQFDDTQSKQTLKLIRRKRLFAELEKAASLFYLAGNKVPEVRRHWAQALLDQNRVAQALSALEAMVDEVEDDPAEKVEVRGLIGRAYKQLYVNEGDPVHLVKAIQAYRPGWQERQADYRWHGINLAALLARAERDGIDPKAADQVAQIAGEILADIKKLEQEQVLGVWDYGTAMEASIALNDYDEAITWARRYVTHKDADAFELASTRRQLLEVWKLAEQELWKKSLLPVLEYELIRREGGMLELKTASVPTQDGFEAVYGSEGYTYLDWIETMYKCCNSIARVFNTATGEPCGTGFLARGSELRPEWGDAPVFITNAHVISRKPTDEPCLRPGDGSAEFTRLPSRPKIKLGKLLFSSAKIKLDVSVFQIETPAEALPLTPTPYLPVIPAEEDSPQRIYVIGHPKGGDLAISLYNNQLVEYPKDQQHYVHYRSPTEHGHSGSPVFTREWKLFAIHHRTREELKVNEGVLFQSIKQAAAS